MKDLSIWLVALIMMVFAWRYTYQICKKQIKPTLSTWIIFLLGTALSLVTYWVAEDHDLRSGILNTMDVASVAIILLATIIWGDRGLTFKPFEKWYLLGIGVIVVYGLWSGNAWQSNIFTQVLIGLGYIPTIQNLVTEKRNTESFTAWGCGIAAGLVGLYPAVVDGNTLAMVYAGRTIVLVSGIMLVMAYYTCRQKR